jgi:putative membrane protein
VSTLVVCIDRGETVADAAAGIPVVSEQAVRSLVTDVGLSDPESSRVNCLLEGLRLARERRGAGEEPVVAVVSGKDDSVDADREIARQIDELLAAHDIRSAVVVTDNAADERLVHVVESRVQVDAVSRVVVRQARDLESTYYLLKQFLADEELRQTVLVPLGVALLAIPLLVVFAQSLTVAVAAVAAITGLFVLYKGLGIDDALASLTGGLRDGLYTGRVSVVTSVIAAGLALVGLVAGAISATRLAGGQSVLVTAMAFLFDSVPWLTTAALTVSTGRAADEWLHDGRVRTASLNLPFVVVAVGFVVRGFAAYFLERAGVIGPFRIPSMTLGVVSIRGFSVTGDVRLVAFVLAGILLSLLGVAVAARIGGAVSTDRAEQPEQG